MSNSIGEKIAILRKTKNLSQSDIAKELYVSNKTVSKWECGNGIPDVETLKKLADFFHVSLDYFVDDKTPATKNQEPKTHKKLPLKVLIISISVALVVILSTMLAVFIPRTPSVKSSEFEINQETLTMSCVIDNSNESFSFNGKIDVPFRNTWKVYSDINATNEITSNVVSLSEGDNTFYLLITNSNNDKKLYTITIRRKPLYTLEFNSNGGSDIENQIVEEEKLATEPNAPTKTGYTFVGWDYDFSNQITEDITINALWAANEYTLNLDTNLSTYQINPANAQFENEESTYSVLCNYNQYYRIPRLTHDYWTCKGFSLTPNGSVQFYLGSSYKNLAIGQDDAVTLYAVWEINNYNIIYNLSSGTNNSNNPSKYNYETATFELADAEREFYTFCGWFTDYGYENQVTQIEKGSSGNITLYAKFEPADQLKYRLSSDKTHYSVVGYFDNPTEISVKSTYNDLPVTEIASNAFSYCSNLETVNIPNSVTSIGSSAFSGCSSLKNMTIPFVGDRVGATVNSTYQYPFGYIFGTSSYTNGIGTLQNFYGSSTSATTSNYYYIPSGLESVRITGGNVLYGAFMNCGNIADITIEENVTYIANQAFNGCNNLTNIEVDADNDNYLSIDGNLYTKDVTRLMQYAIGKAATEFTIPDTVTTIDSYAFSGSLNLTSITIQDGTLEICNYAFSECLHLTEIAIPQSVTTIGKYVFKECALTSVIIPSSVTLVDESVFFNCNTLNKIYCEVGPKPNGWDQYWKNCCSATVIWIFECKLSSDGFSYEITKYNGSSDEIVLPRMYNGLPITSVGAELFKGYTDLTSVTIPNSITNISEYAFSGCSHLTSIIIPDSVKTIGQRAFQNCGQLVSATIPGDADIGNNAFYFCLNIRVIISSGSTKIRDRFLFNCSNVRSIVIPKSVTDIGNSAFYYCSGLTSVIIPNSVISMGHDVFGNCTNLGIIYCEATEQPTTWDTNWKGVYCEANEIWNYNG